MARSGTQDVREKLLEAGVRTFGRLGFNGCSVQDITDAAGVPKGSFYNHFESKEALGAAAIDHYWEDGACARLEILTDPKLSPRRRLERYFEALAADMAEAGFTCGCLIGNMAAELSDHSPLIAARIAAVLGRWSRSVGACIHEAQAAGEIQSTADPERLATFVLNAWEGAVLRARLEKGQQPLRQFQDMLSSHILR